MGHGDFKALTRRTASDKILCDKYLILLKIRNMMDINMDLLQWSISFLIKKTSVSGIKNENMLNKKLSEELYKLIIRRFEEKSKLTFYRQYLEYWSSDMQLIIKFNKGICVLLCVIDIFGKYVWLIPLKGITITNAFHKVLKESNRKPNKIWVDNGSEFYNRSMKWFSWNNNIKMYSAYDEGKSVVTGRFMEL